jgi:hypothetical protein
MNMELEINKFIKKILSVTNLPDLKSLVDEINSFLKENNIKENSENFKKLDKAISIMKMKLSHGRKYRVEGVNSKSYLISESQLTTILYNLTK